MRKVGMGVTRKKTAEQQLKEAKTKITALKKENEELKEKNAALMDEIEELKKESASLRGKQNEDVI